MPSQAIDGLPSTRSAERQPARRWQFGADRAKADTSTSMAITYHIEEADLSASAAAIQGLWVANLAGHDSRGAAAKLRLGYAENPAGPGTAILLYPDNETLPRGVQGLHPRVFHFGARRLRAAGLADYAVDADHRSLGPALMLMRRGTQLGAERFDLTYGLPNRKAAAVLARAGLKRLGTVRRYARPLFSRPLLAQRLPTWLADLLAPMVDAALGMRDAWHSAALRPRLECSATGWDDPAIDELWSRRPDSLLLSERSGAMLRWRFGAPERGDWRLCMARDRDGDARGYVVWRLTDGFAEVGDFFSPDPDACTAPLMLSFSRLARRERANSVSVTFFGSEQVAQRLLASGMALRPHEAPLFTLPGGVPELESPGRWYLTSFDNDAD